MKRSLAIALFASLATSCLFAGGGSEPIPDTGSADLADTGPLADADADTGDVAPAPDAAQPDAGRDTGPDDDASDMSPDMPEPMPSLVVTHKGDIVDPDGCTTEHCTLREAVAAASALADAGDAARVEFAFVEPPDGTLLGIDGYIIRLDSTLRIDAPITLHGPDPMAARISVEAGDAFSGGPIVTITSDVVWRRAAVVGRPDAQAIDVESGDVTLEDIIIFGAKFGLLVRGGRVQATGLGVGVPRLLPRPDAIAGNGFGVVVTPNGSLDLDDSTVAGNSGHGIYIYPGANLVRVTNSIIGQQRADSANFGNGGHGIVARRGNVTIAGNRIANNAISGVLLDVAPGATGTTLVAGNYIGGEHGNARHGIDIVAAPQVMVGNPMRTLCNEAEGCNVIVGNGGAGLRVHTVAELDVAGNSIGYDPTSFGIVPNAFGVVVSRPDLLRQPLGESCAVGSDCVSGVCLREEVTSGGDVEHLGGQCVTNCPNGEMCDTTDTAQSGVVAIGPRSAATVPSNCGGPCNLISGNAGTGVATGAATTLKIQGNYLGTNPLGTVPPNSNVGNGIGIDVISPTADIVGNVVAASAGDGVRFSGDRCLLQENYIGVDANGDAPGRTSGNGGIGAYVDARAGEISNNTISANGGGGLHMSDGPYFDGEILNNAIGTSADQMSAIGNQGDGLVVNGCDTCLVGGNRLVANANSTGGVGLRLGGNQGEFRGTVQANHFGYLADGSPATQPNAGILVLAARGALIDANIIHNVSAGSGAGAGIWVRRAIDSIIVGNDLVGNVYGIDASGSGDAVTTVWDHNTFFDNTRAIRLSNTGNDTGDVDTGPNHLLNAPTWATQPSGGSLMWSASIGRSIAGARVELLASPSAEDVTQHLGFCQETLNANSINRTITCTATSAGSERYVVAIQSARRVLLRVPAAQNVSVNLSFANQTYTLAAPAGPTAAATATALRTEVPLVLPSGTYVVAPGSDECLAFFGPNAECVDLTLPFETIVSNPVNLSVSEGHISSELSAPATVP